MALLLDFELVESRWTQCYHRLTAVLGAADAERTV
jgi:hypothetical protein